MNFILVGGAPIVTRCGEALLARGHVIAHVVARSAGVREWALARGLPASSGKGADAAAAIPPADYIVSAANDLILSPAVLAKARKGAVNLHNSKLPAYRGAFAASWAILDGQVEHGATWHMIGSRIDSGSVIADAAFPIQPDDTARSLNARCMEAGLALFRDAVVPAFERPLLPRRSAGEGHYYPVARRAPRLGVIDWRLPADDVLRVVRALDRGPIDNSFDTAKLLVGDGCWTVPAAQVLPGRRLPPGSLVASPGMPVVLGTATSALALHGLVACAGNAAATPLRSQQLQLPSAEALALAERLGRAAATAEDAAVARWVDRVGARDLAPAALSALDGAAADGWTSLATMLAQTVRSADPAPVRIGVQTPAMADVPHEIAPLFAAAQPLLLDPAEPSDQLAERLQQIDQAGPVLADVWNRRSGVRAQPEPKARLRIIGSTDGAAYVMFLR